MNRLLITIQEKGGVSKTFLTIHLVSYLRSLGHVVRPVDLDLTDGLITKVFPPPDSATLSPDVSFIRSGESRMPDLLQMVIEGKRFAIDCGANTGNSWDVLFREVCPHLPKEMEAAGVKITLIVPVTSDEKTWRFFDHYKTQFPNATQIMVVVREHKDEQFTLPRHPAELTIELPLAVPKLFTTYRSMGMSIDQIAVSELPDLRLVRSFARGYLPQLHATFDKIKKHLLP